MGLAAFGATATGIPAELHAQIHRHANGDSHCQVCYLLTAGKTASIGPAPTVAASEHVPDFVIPTVESAVITSIHHSPSAPRAPPAA